MSKDLAFRESAKRAQDNLQWDIQEPIKAVIALEFTDELKPELYGLEVSEAKNLVGGIDVLKAELEVLKNAYVDVIQLAITTENLPIFKDLRKNFSKNRTSAEKLRKAKKSYFLNGGRFVDAVFKSIDAERELMESKLLEAEKFFENQEKEKARLLNESRIERLKPFVEDVTGLDFAPMSDEDFDDYLLGKKTRFENEVKEKKEAEAKAEHERLAGIERQKAVEAENIKLKTEAEAKEKALKQEREEIQKKAKIEADKQAKIQAEKDAEIKKLAKELQVQKDIEEAIRLAKIEEAKTPVNNQLLNWIDSFELPELVLENDTKNEILLKFQGFKNWSKTQIK